MFNSILKKYNEYKSFRTTLRELGSLSDRELADLGMNRADLKAISKSNARQTFIGA